MTEEKNKRKDKPFIKETIAGPNPKKKRRKLLEVVFLALLAGVIAGLAFLAVVWFSPRPDDSEETPQETTETPEETETESSTDEPMTEVATETPEADIEKIVEAYLDEQLGVDMVTEYAKIMHRQISKSFVDVLITTTDTDWMSQNYTTGNTVKAAVLHVKNNLMYLMLDGDSLDGSETYQVDLRESKRPATIFAKDQLTGLQILTTDISDLTPMELGAYPPVTWETYATVFPGDFVMAVGNPTGNPGSMDFGYVTYRDKCYDCVDCHYDIICTDMTAYENGSGLLINAQGKVVGFLADSHKNDNFDHVIGAISITNLNSIIQGMLLGQPVGYLGVVTKDVTKDQESQLGTSYGVFITETLTETPAFVSGLQNGDIIVGCGSENVYNTKALQTILSNAKAGDTLELTVLRWSRDAYKEIKISVVLAGRP